MYFRHNQRLRQMQKAVIASTITAFYQNHHKAYQEKRSLTVNFFVIVNSMNNTLAGNLCALELLDKNSLLFK